jgi:hypothetical protein
MKKFILVLAIGIASLIVLSCNQFSKQENTATTDTIAAPDTVQRQNAPVDSIDVEVKAYGKIKAIADGAYPMYIVTVEFPEQKKTVDLNLNVEEIAISISDLEKLRGKYAYINYKETMENRLVDIHFEGKTLYGADAPKLDASYKRVTGILSGAEQETTGDLPDALFITDSIGTKMAFKEYITPETVAKNGEKVTVYYYTNNNQTITKITATND